MANPAPSPSAPLDQPSGQSRSGPVFLFTAFEPSGDAHAAPVIAELKRRVPDAQVCAWGGARMQAAGATIIERTCDDGSMGLGAFAKASAVRKSIKRLKAWAKGQRIVMHVPVDSPAANFPICKFMKKSGVRVVHLVAPQLWAWGRWRQRKLRKRTDLLLCLLPFEEAWFRDRYIPARFIGHPVMNSTLDESAIRERMLGLPQGSPRVAIFPGSRTQEVKANMWLLSQAFTELQGRSNGMSGLIVAANGDIAKLIRKKVKVFPTGLAMTTGHADAAIQWCDLALAVSGTVSLQIARHRKPMIGVYKTSVFAWLIAKIMLRTPFRLLPNIIADREIVPEFVPHVGGPMPIVKEASVILQDSKNAAIQSEELSRVCHRFSNKRPAKEAVELMLKILRGEPV